MTDSPIWERLPSDTDKSYEAFCIYRDMGAQRSLQKAWEQYQNSTKTVPGYFKQWSVEHNWSDRVSMYQAYQNSVRESVLSEVRADIQNDALQDYYVMRFAIAKRIEILENTDYISKVSDLHELISLMEHANAYARLNSGLPNKITENSNKQSGSVTLNHKVPDLPDSILSKLTGNDNE